MTSKMNQSIPEYSDSKFQYIPTLSVLDFSLKTGVILGRPIGKKNNFLNFSEVNQVSLES